MDIIVIYMDMHEYTQSQEQRASQGTLADTQYWFKDVGQNKKGIPNLASYLADMLCHYQAFQIFSQLDQWGCHNVLPQGLCVIHIALTLSALLYR